MKLRVHPRQGSAPLSLCDSNWSRTMSLPCLNLRLSLSLASTFEGYSSTINALTSKIRVYRLLPQGISYGLSASRELSYRQTNQCLPENVLMIDLAKKILCMAGKLRYSALGASFNATTIFTLVEEHKNTTNKTLSQDTRIQPFKLQLSIWTRMLSAGESDSPFCFLREYFTSA